LAIISAVANCDSPPAIRTYNKGPTTFREQVAKLKQRGMQFDDDYIIKTILEHINYYHLEAYWFTYYDTTVIDHQFLPDTKFSDIWRDYSFDRKLRALILQGLERIEISFRTQFTYFLAHKYGNFPFAKNNFYFSQDIWDENIDKLKKTCSESGEQFAVHFREAYGMEIFPIWAISELLSFGRTVVFYKNLKDQILRKEISRVYGLEPQIFDSWLDHLYSVRNLCAHHARVWNRRFVKTPKESKNIRKDVKDRWISMSQPCPSDDPRNDRRIFNTFLMIEYLLSNICHGNHWKQDLVALIKESNIDWKRMGFPDGWDQDVFWVGNPQ
jgi:abortive infection bacteriophage resistance protein